MRQTLRHNAATIRPILRAIFAFAVFLSLFPLASRAEDSGNSRRDAAKAQFERAQKARQALEAHPESGRTLKDYTALVIQYQRVYLITSHAADVPASLNEVAELFRIMGDLFDAKYYQRSIDSYQFLMKEYPTSKYREDALLAIAHIEQDAPASISCPQQAHWQNSPLNRRPLRIAQTECSRKRSPPIRLRRQQTRSKEQSKTPLPTRMTPAQELPGCAPGTPTPIPAS
jgi:hypothetical protein